MDDFLLKAGMHVTDIDMDKEVETYLAQMKDGLEGRTASLMMIPTYISLSDNIPCNKRVLIIDAGGTNLRLATAVKTEQNGIEISDFSQNPMVGTRGRVTIRQFFEQMTAYMEPYLNDSEITTVGFCFSFNTDILPDRDAIINYFSKEVDVVVDGTYCIGKSINEILTRRGRSPLKFVILNDTVATMLGGIAKGIGTEYESYIGYILGTGTNLCYLEDTQNIRKSSSAMATRGRMAINCESGMYDGFRQGRFDAELDAQSLHPGLSKMEKMMSGAYQGILLYRTALGAVDVGLFSPQFADGLKEYDAFTMRQVDEFCVARSGDGDLARLCGDNKRDNDNLYRMIEVSIQRAACLTTVIFTATMLQAGCGKLKERPVCITAEGTTFHKSVLFRAKLKEYIAYYIEGKRGLYCHIANGQDTTLIGAAVAALME